MNESNQVIRDAKKLGPAEDADSWCAAYVRDVWCYDFSTDSGQ